MAVSQDKKRVLVVGSGGREHSICHKISSSHLCGALFAVPGNAGISRIATCVSLQDNFAVLDFCFHQDIDLVVIGPEQPLADGLVDLLQANNIAVFGPNKQAAQLETSKIFTKQIASSKQNVNKKN